ncbi:MAG TPA: DUF418 domain-containing protein [Gemmatimonadaceae bacterium]|jgi:uncharacterized protein|nr:DUF418 domain-containing protein [Gemmatimonadaceae bacterium]
MTSAAPTTRQERIYGIDVLRGVALLGILMANIEDFGIPEGAHDIPIGMPKAAFIGPHAHLHLVIVTLKWLFIEGKMRAIFSMLFGAGVIMLTTRAERRRADADIADVYFRRNMWLTAFGFLHGWLIWSGDILFYYGLTALLFLYPCRTLGAKTLVLAGMFVSLVPTPIATFAYLGALHDFSLAKQIAVIDADRRAGHALTPDQLHVQQQWAARVDSHVITPQTIETSMSAARAPYVAGAAERFDALYVGPRVAVTNLFALLETLGAMLIGMGLFKAGFLTGERSYRTYAWTAAVGFLGSAPLYVLGMWKAYASGFDFLTIERWLYAPYFLTRMAGALAIVSVLLIIIKRGALRGLQALLAAVGRTALTNYLLTSVLCQFIFLWGPWKLYGKLEYYQLNFIVFGVWALNLGVSALWLRAFECGPVEWVWRSLTYVKAQPILRGWREPTPRTMPRASMAGAVDA